MKETEPNLDMTFERVPVAKINPAPYNPRRELQPEDREYQDIKRSIQEHGMVDPLVWNKHNGVLIGGHQRFNVLRKEFNAKSAWCSVVSIADVAREKALNVALNKVGGDWDRLKLAQLFLDLKDLKIDLTLTGFKLDEARNIMLTKPIGEQPEGLAYTTKFEVVVQCANEDDQRKIYDRMTKEGFVCRVLTL